MTLDNSKKGQHLRIVEIRNPDVKTQVIRFGLTEGEEVICQEVIPAGPVILRKNHQELAIGRRLAKDILVTPIA